MANNDIIHEFDNETNENLIITLRNVPDMESGLVMALNGYIDTYNSPFFQKQVQRVIEAGFIRLIFDCSALSRVSSTGIGSFSAFLKTVKPQGGDLVLYEIQPKVYEVFQLLGFSQFFNITETLDRSIHFFRGDAAAAGPETFPKLFVCPTCSTNLQVVKSGRFRCSECKSIFTLDKTGAVSLG